MNTQSFGGGGANDLIHENTEDSDVVIKGIGEDIEVNLDNRPSKLLAQEDEQEEEKEQQF